MWNLQLLKRISQQTATYSDLDANDNVQQTRIFQLIHMSSRRWGLSGIFIVQMLQGLLQFKQNAIHRSTQSHENSWKSIYIATRWLLPYLNGGCFSRFSSSKMGVERYSRRKSALNDCKCTGVRKLRLHYKVMDIKIKWSIYIRITVETVSNNFGWVRGGKSVPFSNQFECSLESRVSIDVVQCPSVWFDGGTLWCGIVRQFNACWMLL